jgi:ribosomal protein S18 acetylase RimI-like enzyme
MKSQDDIGVVGNHKSYQDIDLRTACAGDLAELQSIDAEAFGTLAYPAFVLRQFFDVHHDSLLVAAHPDGLRGYSLGVPTADRRQGWLLALAVRREHRGRGYGRALTSATLALLRSYGVRTAYLTVAPENTAAVALYRSVGFTVRSEAKDYLGAGQDRMIMTYDFPVNGQSSGFADSHKRS